MDSKLRERFERLGPIRAVDRVSSGSPGVFQLQLLRGPGLARTIDGMFALARRGLSMIGAKRAVEALIDSGHASVRLPTVESTDVLVADLARAGISAVRTEDLAAKTAQTRAPASS